MASVTERIRQIGNAGRYIKMSDFEKRILSDDITLNDYEGGVDKNGSIVGSAVEYLTRFFLLSRDMLIGKRFLKAFEVSCTGAVHAQAYYGVEGAVEVFTALLTEALNKPDKLITNACKLVTFDVWYRNPLSAVHSRTYEEVNPDGAAIENIRNMVKRSVRFFKEREPVISAGFDFAPSGYTKTVHSGDGDFLTADTLWDMKVRRSRLKSDSALQVLMYWIMGQHSGEEIFRDITKIGIYNPRQNVAYILDTEKISPEVIREIEDEVICY